MINTETMAGDRPQNQPDAVFGIVIVHSPDPALRNKVIQIGAALTFGRGDGEVVGVTVQDGKVSRRHLSITRRDRVALFDLKDEGSRNGTRVNGLAQTTATLSMGDVVRIGETVMIFDRIDGMLDEGADKGMVGRSRPYARLLEGIARVAETDVPVLLLGETGTGKEVVARCLHEQSGRRGELLALNCGAVPRDLVESFLFGHKKGAFTGATQDGVGYFERARGGTLFLDEIGELGIDQQPRLLRVLENKEFAAIGSTQVEKTDARVVAATNADLAARSETGVFRRDLYARLAGFVLRLPPLRDRKADIPLIVAATLNEQAHGQKVTLSADAWEELLLHRWPMNIRELKTVVGRMLLAHPAVDILGKNEVREAIAMTEPDRTDGLNADTAAESRPSKEALEQTLTACAGNIVQVAAHFGKHPKQVYRWIERYQISVDRFR